MISEVGRERNQKAFTRPDGNAGPDEIVDETRELQPVGLFDIRQDQSRG